MVHPVLIKKLGPVFAWALLIACCFCCYLCYAKSTDPKTYLPKPLHFLV